MRKWKFQSQIQSLSQMPQALDTDYSSIDIIIRYSSAIELEHRRVKCVLALRAPQLVSSCMYMCVCVCECVCECVCVCVCVCKLALNCYYMCNRETNFCVLC